MTIYKMAKKNNKALWIILIIFAVIILGYVGLRLIDSYLFEKSAQSSGCGKQLTNLINYAESSNPEFKSCYNGWGEKEYLKEHGMGVNTDIAIYCAERINDVQLYKSLTEADNC